MLTRILRLFNVRFTTVYCLAVLIFSSQTRLFCTVYRQYTCIYTINMWKGRGKSDRGYFLTCERVEEDSKQEWDSCMTVRYGYWCSVLSRLRLPRFRSEQFANRAVKSPRLRAGKKLTIFVFPRLRKVGLVSG